MLHTACATTATATSFKPCKTASVVGPSSRGANSAKPNITIAEGNVKPAQAANAPAQPARRSPIRKPVWLLAGPGTIWHKATSPAYSSGDSHCRSRT